MSESTEQQKTAGAVVYLMEELGDARMRCDQLLRYIEKASKLVEKSPHKDHFFEVAGDVIRGIPETAFKLHKALEAVALAANRIDYEEIKQDLRPEKVEELERVLKDVRVRQVQRRSQPMVNPASVVEQLKSLAKKAREGGRLDTEALSTLIASLEAGAPKVAEDAAAKVATQLEAMAHALENPPEGEQPSRLRLAQVLRRTLGDQLELTKLAADEEKQSRYEEGKPADPTKNMSKEDAQEWKDNTEEHKDKFKKEGKELRHSVKTAADEEKQSRYEEGKPADPTENMSKEDAKAWKENTDEYGDKFKKEAAKPPEGVTSQLNAAIDQLKKVSRGTGNPKLLLIGAFTSISDALTKMGQDEALENLIDRITATIRAKWSQKEWMEAEKEKTAAEPDEKQSRFEEGKPADPTKDMSEADAKKWKENTDEYGDKFKKDAKKVVPVKKPSRKVIDAIMGAAIGGEEVAERWQKNETVPSHAAIETYQDLAEKKNVDRATLAEFKKHLESYHLKVASGGASWKAA